MFHIEIVFITKYFTCKKRQKNSFHPGRWIYIFFLFCKSSHKSFWKEMFFRDIVSPWISINFLFRKKVFNFFFRNRISQICRLCFQWQGVSPILFSEHILQLEKFMIFFFICWGFFVICNLFYDISTLKIKDFLNVMVLNDWQ